jgi:putative Mg2+ transporter-C (MgtC) family protein
MPINITWFDIAIRLVCALIAGAAIGLNRSERGHAAGLRTSILVCMAACIAMLQVNLLLPLAGRAANSFVMNDLMRLPLGILSGMGFIGGGAIVRRDNFVVGVTTAATMWFLTVIGLCVGGGQVAVGMVGAAIGLLVLVGLKVVEENMKQDHQGKLVMVTDASGPSEDEIRSLLQQHGFWISASSFVAAHDSDTRELTCDLRWRATPGETKVPEFVRGLAARSGVARLAWSPQGK